MKHYIKNKIRKNVLLIFMILFAIFYSNFTLAQNPLTLNNAIETAIANNLTIKRDNAKENYAKALIETYKSVPNTTISADLGQNNSAYFDTKFSISQMINMPIVYQKQKTLLQTEWKAAMLESKLNEPLIRKAITQIYYDYSYYNEKIKILQKSDSIYNILLDKASIRLKNGETNGLEKASYEMQKNSIQLQILTVKNEKKLIETQLQYWLRKSIIQELQIVEFKNFNFANLDTSNMENHPYLKALLYKKEIINATAEVEKTKLLPQLLLGYNLASIRGIGANNKEYNNLPQFQNIQVGVSVPLFKKSIKAKIAASKMQEQIVLNEYDLEKQSLQNKIAFAIEKMELAKKMIQFYNEKMFINIKNIQTISNSQYKNGEISYVELIMQLNQYTSIENNYLDEFKNFNDAIIEINFLTSK